VICVVASILFILGMLMSIERRIEGLKRIILIEIEREPVIHLYRSEMSGGTFILEAEDVGKKRADFSLSRTGIIE